MRLAQDRLATTKNYIHAAQGCILFLAAILTIAVYTRDGSTDGRTSWYFALVGSTKPRTPEPRLTSVVLLHNSDLDLPCHGAHVVSSPEIQQCLCVRNA